VKRQGFFILALVFGLIAAGSAYVYLRGASRTPPVELRPLVVAKTAIPARTVIQADQLTVKDVPRQGYPQGGASTIANVAGAVALVNLAPGDPVLNPMIQRPVSKVDAATPSLTIPEGKRAVAVPISLVSGVGYAVRPGDHVDVLVTMEQKDPAGNNKSYTSLAAQDVLVLGVGDSLTGDKGKVEIRSYILALSVPQAMVVTLGSEKGSIRLLLRNPVNSEIQRAAPVSGEVLLSPNYFDQFK